MYNPYENLRTKLWIWKKKIHNGYIWENVTNMRVKDNNQRNYEFWENIDLKNEKVKIT